MSSTFDAGSIVGRIDLDTSDMTRGVQAAAHGASEITGKLQKVAGAATKASIALAAVGATVMTALGVSIREAMHVEEAENLFKESFGAMASEVRAWSESVKGVMGMTGTAVREAAGTFNVMLSSMGFADESAAKMAKTFTFLAGDMMSFYDIPFEDALMKLRSGITGQTEPLMSLGIMLDEATVKAWAYTHGIAELGAQLTSTQKVAARYGAILEQTNKAQEDQVRTGDSATNQSRRLEAAQKDLAATVGKALLPAYTDLVRIANRFLKHVTEMVEKYPGLVTALAAIGIGASVAAAALAAVAATAAGAAAASTIFAGPAFAASIAALGSFSVAAAGVVAVLAGMVAVIYLTRGAMRKFRIEEKLTETTLNSWAGQVNNGAPPGSVSGPNPRTMTPEENLAYIDSLASEYNREEASLLDETMNVVKEDLAALGTVMQVGLGVLMDKLTGGLSGATDGLESAYEDATDNILGMLGQAEAKADAIKAMAEDAKKAVDIDHGPLLLPRKLSLPSNTSLVDDGLVEQLREADEETNRLTESVDEQRSVWSKLGDETMSVGDFFQELKDVEIDDYLALAQQAAGALGGKLGVLTRALGLARTAMLLLEATTPWGAVMAGVNLAIEALGFFGDKAEEVAKGTDAVMEDFAAAWQGWSEDITDAIVEMVRTGTASFRELVDSILEDMLRITTQRLIVEPVMDALGGAFSKSGAAAPVNVVVNNASGVGAAVTESTGANGVKAVEVLISRTVETAVRSGALDSAFRQTYGLARVGVSR